MIRFHVVVGGNGGLMIDPATAAQDPIFWLHHCRHVDRLWELWLRRGSGANPTTAAWRDETHRFGANSQATPPHH